MSIIEAATIVIKGWFSAALAILVSLGSYGQNLVSPKEIDVIYVKHGGFMQKTVEYKVDLKEKKLWEFVSEDFEGVRNASAENEGFTFVRDLEDDKIEVFLREAKRYGLASWQDEYVDAMILDGEAWKISIAFADGTEKVTKGSNRHLLAWNGMYDAFRDLTGEPVLRYRLKGLLFGSVYYFILEFIISPPLQVIELLTSAV